MGGANDIRLRWVLSDPSRERGVDPLGMSAQADRIADRLLPQLSVATTRARYFSFLCWAVHEARGSKAPASTIHRLEAELAIEEANRHWDESPEACPDVVGRSRARAYLDQHSGKSPARPERLYKSTAFATYRPAMRALGLLTRGRRPELTSEGKRLAGEYANARGRRPRCLSDISNKEQVRLRGALGLDYRRRAGLATEPARRRATWEAIGQLIADGSDAPDILEHHETLRPRSPEVATTLHRAFSWELLSTGLALAFSALLESGRKKPVVKALRDALSKRPDRPLLSEVTAIGENHAPHIVSLLRAALGTHPDRLGLDPLPAALAAQLVSTRDPDGFVTSLVERHRMSKAGDPWIALIGDKVESLAPQKTNAFRVRARTYRMDAFNRLVHDLGMIIEA